MSDGELRDRVRVILLEGNKIEAIKLVRERAGWKLKQSKGYVDELERRFRAYVHGAMRGHDPANTRLTLEE